MAKAAGIRAATAPLVALLEDHTFPAPGWAEGLIKAHSLGHYAATGPVVANANPFSWASWGNFLVYYGEVSFAHPDDQIQHLPANHSCYRREVLLQYQEQLPDLLEMEPAFHTFLLARGHRLHQEPTSIAYHLNFSTSRDGAMEYFHASKIFAAQRRRGWGFGRRLVYAAGSPLLPPLRGLRIVRYVKMANLGIAILLKALIPSFAVLMANAAGEMIGYAIGYGDSPSRLAAIINQRERLFSSTELEKVFQRLSELNAKSLREA
jgi:hypothetical protein